MSIIILKYEGCHDERKKGGFPSGSSLLSLKLAQPYSLGREKGKGKFLLEERKRTVPWGTPDVIKIHASRAS